MYKVFSQLIFVIGIVFWKLIGCLKLVVLVCHVENSWGYTGKAEKKRGLVVGGGNLEKKKTLRNQQSQSVETEDFNKKQTYNCQLIISYRLNFFYFTFFKIFTE